MSPPGATRDFRVRNESANPPKACVEPMQMAASNGCSGQANASTDLLTEIHAIERYPSLGTAAALGHGIGVGVDADPMAAVSLDNADQELAGSAADIRNYTQFFAILEMPRLLMVRMASTCSATASGTKKAGIKRNGNVLIIRLGTSAWIRLNGPGAVNTDRVTTFASATRPSRFQTSAILRPHCPRRDNQAIRGADAPI